jgi:uncharacterized protein (DUF1330 family)
MAAYVVVEIDIQDSSRYADYKRLAPPSIATYGGKYVVRGGRTETLEGDWRPSRLVILEFESAERARAWWGSREYSEAKKLRQQTASAQMVLVEGV